jgi:hypothetical protein
MPEMPFPEKNATHPMVLPHPGHRNFQRVNKRLIGGI